MLSSIQTIVQNMNLYDLERIGVSTGSGLLATLILELVLKRAPSKQIRYFLRANKLDFISGIFAVFGYFIAYVFSEYAGWSLVLSIVVTFIATIMVIHSKTRERDFYFLALKDRSDKDDWIGEGVFEYDRVQKAYVITNSFSGFLFSKCLTWSDYLFDFEFKILNESIGVIVRATNLSNLVMLQIFDHGVKPHIRINGFWQAWEPAAAGLEFPTGKLNLNNWHRCRLDCNKGSIRIRIHDSVGLEHLDREWRIPQGHIAFQTQDTTTEGRVITSTIPFPINLEYGTVGFRNDNVEKATMRNVLIDKL